MKVKIIKALNTECWYKDVISHIFIVENYSMADNMYKISNPESQGLPKGELQFIYKVDCEVIEEEEEKDQTKKLEKAKVRNFEKFEVDHWYVYTGTEREFHWASGRMDFVLNHKAYKCLSIISRGQIKFKKSDSIDEGNWSWIEGFDNWIEVEEPTEEYPVLIGDLYYKVQNNTILKNTIDWVLDKENSNNYYILKRKEKVKKDEFKAGDKFQQKHPNSGKNSILTIKDICTYHIYYEVSDTGDRVALSTEKFKNLIDNYWIPLKELEDIKVEDKYYLKNDNSKIITIKEIHFLQGNNEKIKKINYSYDTSPNHIYYAILEVFLQSFQRIEDIDYIADKINIDMDKMLGLPKGFLNNFTLDQTFTYSAKQERMKNIIFDTNNKKQEFTIPEKRVAI